MTATATELTSASEVLALISHKTNDPVISAMRAYVPEPVLVSLAYAIIADRKDRAAPKEPAVATETLDAAAARLFRKQYSDHDFDRVLADVKIEWMRSAWDERCTASEDQPWAPQALKPDEGGCITKRFVIFTAPGLSPEKKGGWLKDDHLIDFLRDVVLHDGWKPGFRATVLELTWNNDLWASEAVSYLAEHDNAIGIRRARKAWTEAREKHERIYKTAPAAKLGREFSTFRALTREMPAATDPQKSAGAPQQSGGVSANG